MANKTNEWIKKKNNALREGLLCVNCETPEKVEFAHVIKTEVRGKGRGRKERYYDIKNHPLAYIPLCVDCHKRYDLEKAEHRRDEEKN